MPLPALMLPVPAAIAPSVAVDSDAVDAKSGVDAARVDSRLLEFQVTAGACSALPPEIASVPPAVTALSATSARRPR